MRCVSDCKEESVKRSSVEFDQQGKQRRELGDHIQSGHAILQYSTARVGVGKHLITSVDTSVNCGKCQVGQVLTFAGMRQSCRWPWFSDDSFWAIPPLGRGLKFQTV